MSSGVSSRAAASLEELQELPGKVISWFRQHEDYEQLRGLFAELVREGLAARGVAVSDNLLEIKTMKTGFSRNVEEWEQKLLAEGEAKGLVEGIAQGKAEGKAEALLCLLAERFGTVTPSLRNRIAAARLATIERWFKRAIVATDLRSVFAPRRSQSRCG